MDTSGRTARGLEAAHVWIRHMPSTSKERMERADQFGIPTSFAEKVAVFDDCSAMINGEVSGMRIWKITAWSELPSVQKGVGR